MSLKIYNSLSKQKEVFTPLHAPEVTMYVCGVTVYDYCHLGHARASVVFDMIYRYLLFKKYQVKYIRNFTDIDDKIINKANQTGTAWQEITKKFIEAFHEDMLALGNLTPSAEPYATHYILKMQEMIQSLIAKGYAYANAGDVYYRVRSKKDYGKLSHKNIEDLESGARIEIGEHKEDPLDFALWKAAKPGEPSWDSPWGAGRPGWHIECSVMSTELLGPTIDIHGGGRDLIFPHHENELAQSEGSTGKDFVKYWIHNGFVNLNSDKMSKSIGNVLQIREALKHYPAEVLRYFLLSAHYNSPLDYTEENLRQAEAAVERIYQCKQLALQYVGQGKEAASFNHDQQMVLKKVSELEDIFTEAMDDNFNTAQALGYLFDVVRDLYRSFANEKNAVDYLAGISQKFLEKIKCYENVLGIFGQDPQKYLASWQELKSVKVKISETEINNLIDERKLAREKKDFKRADQIRDQLLGAGIEIKDSPAGTQWFYR